MRQTQAPLLVVFTSMLLVAGCSSNKPPELASGTVPQQAAMQEDQAAGRTAMVWRAPGADPRKYTKFIIDPVEIYSGADADWDGTTPQDREQMAQFIRSEFVRVLKNAYPVVEAPGPDVARVHFILAGLAGNVPVIATVSRLAPAGLVLNAGKSAGGQPGSFTGSVTIAGSIRDSQTDAALISFIQKRSPDAMNIGATLTSKAAWEAAISQGAEAFRKRLDEIHGKKGA